MTSPRQSVATASAVGTQLIARPVMVKIAHDEFREPFIEIYTLSKEGKRLVTSIEILSLSNKTPGEQGRELYLRKQKEILAGKAHLVEIDLLRAGEHVSAVPLEAAIEACGSLSITSPYIALTNQKTTSFTRSASKNGYRP
jgi:hypothetical protein